MLSSYLDEVAILVSDSKGRAVIIDERMDPKGDPETNAL